MIKNMANMDELVKKTQGEGGDKEILYSKAIKAGKRIYYLDVKRNLKDELFLAITESKKVQPKNDPRVVFEKHKIFLYREDFEKFVNGMNDVMNYIRQRSPEDASNSEAETGEDSDGIKPDIEF